jgi:uncharacterized protein (UPF0332 family)
MERIRWCLQLKNGIEPVEPNENLSKAYMKKAESSLQTAAILKENRDWSIIASYYSMYFALYSILMKIGMKCEVHSCTIEFMKRFLQDYFTREECEFLKDSMKARTDTQYYVDRRVPDEQYRKILEKTPLFLVKCREVLLKINEEEVDGIRNKVKRIRD